MRVGTRQTAPLSLSSASIFALISDSERHCEGPSPAAEPAAAPHGEQWGEGIRAGSGFSPCVGLSYPSGSTWAGA